MRVPMRTVLFMAIALAIFLPFNIVTIRSLLHLHPRWRSLTIAGAVLGNLMWLFFPLLRSTTPFFRVVRALFGPLWFAWTSFAILYTALIVITALGWAIARLLHGTRFVSIAKWPSRLFLIATAVAVPFGVYDALVPLRIERVPVYLADLPAQAEGTRIAVLSDIHVGLFTRPSRLTKIFATTRALDPHAAVILGDLIDDDPYFVPKLLRGVDALGPHVPLLAVLGNHEMYGDPDRVIAGLRGSRIRLLVNESAGLRGLQLIGLTDPAARQSEKRKALEPDLLKAMATGNGYPVILSHQPKAAFAEAVRRGLPLTLSAHTHGGQCGFRPWRWSLAGVFLKYHMGLYREAASQLFITTGTGYWLVPFRLGMSPEIVVIEIRRASGT